MAQQWWQPATQDEQAQQAQPVLRAQQEALLRQEQALRSRGLAWLAQQERQRLEALWQAWAAQQRAGLARQQARQQHGGRRWNTLAP